MRLDAQLITPLTPRPGGHVHYELLLRMIDEDGNTVGPDRFISAALRYQLMPTIDRWVIEKAIALVKPHAARLSAHPVGFAINFSGQSLNDDDFGDFLFTRIRSSGLDPALFCFELTENATVANIAKAEVLMRRLRRLGCAIALDDFGTGLSSLSYLRQLPVTMLKIDGSFVRDILKDARSESMVSAIAQLARSMSLLTVAEYVETDEIRHGSKHWEWTMARASPLAVPCRSPTCLRALLRSRLPRRRIGARTRSLCGPPTCTDEAHTCHWSGTVSQTSEVGTRRH